MKAEAALIALAMLLPACGRSEPQATDIEDPVPVIAEPVRLGSVRGTISATGVVTSLPGATYTITANQPARIAEITKNVGDPVRSGEVLVRFEFPSLGAETAVNAAVLKASETRLRQARLIQSRVQSLLSRGAASQREMDEADREVAVAENELAATTAAARATAARARNATVHAPFDGIITERLHEPGDAVRPEEGDPILRMIDPRQVQVTASVDASDITRFTVGASGRVLAGRSAIAEPVRVISRPTPEAGADRVPVTLTLDAPTELKPGTEVGVEIDAEQRSNVPLVPAIAVLKDPAGNPYVIVAVGPVAQRRPVVTGLTENQAVEIQSGVKPGELVITQGHSTLKDGAPITVTPP